MPSSSPKSALKAAAKNPPSEAQIRAQLEKILASPGFVHSERLCRFLKLAVECGLSGELERLKEYALGRDVFDRSASYDPRVDSIVRVEARRLRSKLKTYYQESGKDDGVLISFRPGSYVPVFELSESAPPEASGERRRVTDRLNPRTVAVLPFVNLSPDAGQDYFCDGITEEILDALATAPQLNVVARTSVFHFKGRTGDVRKIGEELGAGSVVEGSVRKAGERLRISAQLIDSTTGYRLWSDVFDRDLGDVFTVQDEIARHTASSLTATLAPAQQLFPSARRAPNLEAYESYLRGRYYWNKLTADGLQSAIEQYERTISLYADYAPPYAGLAEAYSWQVYASELRPADIAEKIRWNAEKALRLDESLPEGHAVLGALRWWYDRKWEEGVGSLRKSLALQPGNAVALTYLGFSLLCRGEIAAGMASIDRAIELDPFSLSIRQVRGRAYYLCGDFEKAIAWQQRTIELDPDHPNPHYLLGHMLIRIKRYAEAVEQFEQALKTRPNPIMLSGLGEAYGGWGRIDEARGILAQLDALSSQRYVSPMAYVFVHAGLGEWDQVLEWLERAWEERAFWLDLLKVDPRYDPLREHPRFRRLLSRLDLDN